MTWLIIVAVWILATIITWSLLKTAGDADDRIAQMTHDYHVARDAFGNEVIFPVHGSAPVPISPAEPDKPLDRVTPSSTASRSTDYSVGGSAARTDPPPKSSPSP